jgi:hypothetical protein
MNTVPFGLTAFSSHDSTTMRRRVAGAAGVAAPSTGRDSGADRHWRTPR